MQLPGFNTQCKGNNFARWGYCGNIPQQPCQDADSDDADFALGIGLREQGDPRSTNAPTGTCFYSQIPDSCGMACFLSSKRNASSFSSSDDKARPLLENDALEMADLSLAIRDKKVELEQLNRPQVDMSATEMQLQQLIDAKEAELQQAMAQNYQQCSSIKDSIDQLKLEQRRAREEAGNQSRAKAERATRELEDLEQQRSRKRHQAEQEAEVRARGKKAEAQFTKETQQEYADLTKEFKVDIASIENQIAAAIKTATAESYGTLPGLKQRLERLKELAQEAKAAKGRSGSAATGMAEQVKLREQVRLLRAKAAAGSNDSELPGTGDGTGDGPMPAVPMAFTTLPTEAVEPPTSSAMLFTSMPPQERADMPMTSMPAAGE
eukprot:g2812.t1